MMRFFLAVLVALTTTCGIARAGTAAATNVCRTQTPPPACSCSCCCINCSRSINNSSQCDSPIVDENFDTFVAALTADHWIELVNSEPDLIVWKHRVPSATTIQAKVRFAIDNSDVNSIVALMTDWKQRRHWDAVTADLEVICLSNSYQIVYTVMKIAHLALDRDFVQAVSHRKTTDGCAIILYKDVFCPSCYLPDPTGAVVRGKVGQSGARICSSSDGGSGVVIELHLDYDLGEPMAPSRADTVTAAAQLLLTTWFRNLVNHVNAGKSAPAAAENKTPYPFHKRFADRLIRDEYNCDPDDGWRMILNDTTPTRRGASVCVRHWDGTNAFAFKSFHVIAEARPCDITKILTSYTTRSSWDRSFPKIDVVEKHRHYHVIYWVLGLPPPFVNRDAVLYTTLRRLKDGGYAILYKNYGENECRRPVRGLVRAVAYPSAVFVRPVPAPGKGSIISYNFHLDIGPGITVKEIDSILRGRGSWTTALEGYYQSMGGENASIESDFTINC